MAKVYRVFAEKKKGNDIEASNMLNDLKENVGIKGIEELRIINRYDAQGLSEDEFKAAVNGVFSEPNLDNVYFELKLDDEWKYFATEFLPGQYDQRADSAAQCIQLLTAGERPEVASAKVIAVKGDITDAELDKIKAYVINPVESRLASMDKPESLDIKSDIPADIVRINGFIEMSDDADIRAAGGVSRMSDPKMIKGIQEAVSIPVMAKCRIGHIAEAQILQAIEIDYIDESEVLSPADDLYHIDKTEFDVPFVCGARDLGEALRRIAEGASMIRTKGEPGTGDVVQAVRHMRKINAEMRRVQSLRKDELFEAAKEYRVPVELINYVHENGKLPVVNFAAGGVATPADAALMMQLGAEGVFVGSGIFKSGNPEKRAAAIVKAVTNYNDPEILAQLSEDLGGAMVGINENEIKIIMEERGQ